MPILNPRFEDAGALPGEALHWTLVALTSREVIAGFGVGPELAWEDFERWFELWRSLGDVTVERAFFGEDGFEAFERGWGNDVFLPELPPAQLVQALFGPAGAEDCESGWRNESFAWSWDGVGSVAGLFGSEPVERFEQRWRRNNLFAWNWAAVTSAAVVLADGTSTETFEGAWSPATTI